MKKKFTVLWSHVSFAILLISSLGTVIAIYPDECGHILAGAAVIAVWASLITLNSMALHDNLHKAEGFNAALRVQADLSIHCRRICQRRREGRDELEESQVSSKPLGETSSIKLDDIEIQVTPATVRQQSEEYRNYKSV